MSKFVHHELNTADPAKAKKFYKSLFGWTYQEMPMPGGTYTMVNTKEGPLGGIQQNPVEGAPSSWIGYIAVDSVDKISAKVKKQGGTVVVPKVVIPGIGEFAWYLDPSGASFAVWKELAQPKPAKKKSTKKATKKRSTKKAAKKRSTKKAAKKRSTKKTAKKRSTKKTAKKKAAKKKSTKKTAKKRSTKKTAKKRSTKKAAKKRSTKKTAKKRSTKKAAKKK